MPDACLVLCKENAKDVFAEAVVDLPQIFRDFLGQTVREEVVDVVERCTGNCKLQPAVAACICTCTCISTRTCTCTPGGAASTQA